LTALRNAISAAGIKIVVNMYKIAFLKMDPLNKRDIKIISNITSNVEDKTELSRSIRRLLAILTPTQSRQ
jgi:hypothetical protein